MGANGVDFLIPAGSDPRGFLAAGRIIDHNNPAVQEVARRLADGLTDDEAIAERCYLFVRDEICHSADFSMNPVTLKATDVLLHRTGFCYAKSHLLTALLRADGIPAGLCYQRIRSSGTGHRFALHGLNAVYLKEHGWYRIDARGNKSGIDARFEPPAEHLAFILREPGEGDLPGIFPEPFPEVIVALMRCRDYREVMDNLPDRPFP